MKKLLRMQNKEPADEKMWISQKDARQYAIGIPGEISMRKKCYIEVMAEILPVTSINNLQSGKAH